MAARLIKTGPCLGVRKSRTEAEQDAIVCTKPGAYGNRNGEFDGFVIEPFKRGDGVVVYCIYAGEQRHD